MPNTYRSRLFRFRSLSLSRRSGQAGSKNEFQSTTFTLRNESSLLFSRSRVLSLLCTWTRVNALARCVHQHVIDAALRANEFSYQMRRCYLPAFFLLGSSNTRLAKSETERDKTAVDGRWNRCYALLPANCANKKESKFLSGDRKRPSRLKIVRYFNCKGSN